MHFLPALVCFIPGACSAHSQSLVSSFPKLVCVPSAKACLRSQR